MAPTFWKPKSKVWFKHNDDTHIGQSPPLEVNKKEFDKIMDTWDVATEERRSSDYMYGMALGHRAGIKFKRAMQKQGRKEYLEGD